MIYSDAGRFQIEEKDIDELIKAEIWKYEEVIAFADEVSPDGLITIVQDRKNFDFYK